MQISLTRSIAWRSHAILLDLIRVEHSDEMRLAVLRDGKITYCNGFSHPDGHTYIPPQGMYAFPEGISLPSRADDYGDMCMLYDEVDAFINKYLDIEDVFRVICIYYILLTYVYERFHSIPYLRVIGEPGSGKSTLTGTLGLLVNRGFGVSGCITVPSIFRAINSSGCTLVIDESDFSNESDSSDLIKLLNNGYSKGGSVIRTERKGNDFIPMKYSVFSPKILNGRQRFENEALESRCITYRMITSNSRPISYQLPPEYAVEAAALRNKLFQYRFDNYFRISVKAPMDSEVFSNVLSPRLRQIMIPFLAVAVDEKSRKDIVSYFSATEENIKLSKLYSPEGRLLNLIKDILSRKHSPPELGVSSICYDLFNKYKDAHLNPSPKKVGCMLHDLGLKTRRSTGGNYVLVPDDYRLTQLYLEYGLE